MALVQTLLFTFISIYVCDAYRVGNNPYHHREILARGRYQLEWLIDWQQERVIFNVTAETRGYIGLGLSTSPTMTGSDMILGGVAPSGKPYFSDYHATGNQAPIPDVSNRDWVLHSAWESSSHTLISFSRPFETCDDKQDIQITDNSIYVLWAYGERDNITEYHFVNRGSFIVYLRDPDNAPSSVVTNGPFIPGRSQLPQELQNQNVQVWSVRTNFRIPSKKTTYWCNIHRLNLPRKHHIIGFKFNINEQILSNMHHMLFYRCLTPPGVNASTVFEPVVNHPGEECYSPSAPLGVIQTQFCYELKLGHAIGGLPFFFDDDVGIPVGESTSEYFLFQNHFDNSGGREDLQADLQLDMFITPDLRKNDGGILSLGQHIPGSPSILVPPGSVEHSIQGHCGSFCTARMFPPEGITVSAALLHSHNAGRRLSVRHFRSGRELQPISADENYRFGYQPLRGLRRSARILPGDHVAMRCIVDTSDRNTTTVGGFGTEQEMCLVFMVYHPLLRQFPICRSELISPAYQQRYLAGTTNLTWDQSQLEFVATAPPEVAGMTVSQISDSGRVNWNLDLRESLQRDHENHPQVAICPSIAEAQQAQLTPPQFVIPPVTQSRNLLSATQKRCPQKSFKFDFNFSPSNFKNDINLGFGGAGWNSFNKFKLF